MISNKVSVIGAGIAGVTTAYYLAKAGIDVEIIDGKEYPAMGTSYANGGQISVSNSETWNSYRNLWKGIKWLTNKSAPLRLNLTPSWDKYSWLIKFLSEIPNADKNTIKTCLMAIESRELYKKIELEENINYDSVKKGILHFYKSQKEFDHAIKANQIYSQAGLEREVLTTEEIYNLEPSLATKNIIGGLYTKSDFTGDIHKFCRELANKLKKEYRVKIFREEITSLKDFGNSIVVCAGTGSKRLAKTVGDHLPIYPVKGYSITIQNPQNAPWVSLLDDEAKIVASRLGQDRLRVAGTAEFNGYNMDIPDERIRPLIHWVQNNFPSTDTSDFETWTGLRPMTPNMMPIVRKSKKNNYIWYHTGHGHLGWTLSAYTAKTISEKIIKDLV
ncbi:MAG: FAD-dependent oxidoreductase [Hyphomicrobiales bacterium]